MPGSLLQKMKVFKEFVKTDHLAIIVTTRVAVYFRDARASEVCNETRTGGTRLESDGLLHY